MSGFFSHTFECIINPPSTWKTALSVRVYVLPDRERRQRQSQTHCWFHKEDVQENAVTCKTTTGNMTTDLFHQLKVILCFKQRNCSFSCVLFLLLWMPHVPIFTWTSIQGVLNCSSPIKTYRGIYIVFHDGAKDITTLDFPQCVLICCFMQPVKSKVLMLKREIGVKSTDACSLFPC